MGGTLVIFPINTLTSEGSMYPLPSVNSDAIMQRVTHQYGVVWACVGVHWTTCVQKCNNLSHFPLVRMALKRHGLAEAVARVNSSSDSDKKSKKSSSVSRSDGKSRKKDKDKKNDK